MTDMSKVQHPLVTAAMGPPVRVIRKVFVAGLVVSTVETNDIGWETAIAIIGSDDWHPVERYPDQESAGRGHDWWIERAPDLIQVTDLGLPGYEKPRLVSLARTVPAPGAAP
jgi:hypothetical protein